MLVVRIKTSVGSSLEHTDRLSRSAEEFITAQPEVARYFSAVGGFGGGEPNSGFIFVSMHKSREKDPCAREKNRR
jgi:HAE1 family hydrophobic/amphiphilic exporter-1